MDSAANKSRRRLLTNLSLLDTKIARQQRELASLETRRRVAVALLLRLQDSSA